MRTTHLAAAVATAGLITAALFASSAPADASSPTDQTTAAVNHYKSARADWIKSAHVSAALSNRYRVAAGRQLAHDGARYLAQRKELATLESIPLTDATPAQRRTATQTTRQLNLFFHTPGLGGVRALGHFDYARRNWIARISDSAAMENRYLSAASRQLAYYGDRYRTQRKQLATLESIPLTDTTPAQRATARRIVRALDDFFGVTTG